MTNELEIATLLDENKRLRDSRSEVINVLYSLHTRAQAAELQLERLPGSSARYKSFLDELYSMAKKLEDEQNKVPINEYEIYQKAWKRWGNLQYIMLFEEMAELTKSITKEFRNLGDMESVREEIADMQIMLNQMKVKYGIEECESHKVIKLKRLWGLVNGL